MHKPDFKAILHHIIYVTSRKVTTDILKVDFLRGQNFSFEILRNKKVQKHH